MAAAAYSSAHDQMLLMKSSMQAVLGQVTRADALPQHVLREGDWKGGTYATACTGGSVIVNVPVLGSSTGITCVQVTLSLS